jgi:hypothetical protein
MSHIKNSAIPLSGYIYQNYIGLEILCNWLDDPDRYKWVQFEADNDEIPKGLDDVVSMGSDGSLSLLQVKFTVDSQSEENQLSFDWLLARKGKGRSLLQKWDNALQRLKEFQVREVGLVTNRRPDFQLEHCLDVSGARLTFDKFPDEVRASIVEQLTESRARDFFLRFEFRHSYKGIESLDRTLLDRYVPRHASHHAWLQLMHVAIREWAVLVNRPPPDGRITLALLRSVLDRRRPEPLSQTFKVPANYCPPDRDFHERFVHRINDPKLAISVLWGSPGQGKSTYLSYMCADFEKTATPYIRHHYFLSLTDTSDRFAFVNVSNSLMAQIEARHAAHVQSLSSNPEELRAWISACGKAYALHGKRFFVVVDGLDHVWRENDRDRGPLDSLFRHLLPVPENVSVVIGTQRVSGDQLPQSLSTFATLADWVELPRMSISAVRTWLDVQHEAQRFACEDLPLGADRDPLSDLAKAMHEVSEGHPLHLTYSLETLVRDFRTLTPDLVRDLPVCPGGDIHRYYRNLWNGLSTSAKDALHLVSGVSFTWPEYGLEDCLSASYGELRNEIGHLFYFTEAGWLPFHGSILAFIREVADHKSRFTTLLPVLTSWLLERAPPFHRWGWLWLIEAEGGRTENLLTGPTRKWLIDSLSNGYPDAQIVAILAAAERIAFMETSFPAAIRFRWLKIRLLNGMEFQLEHFRDLEQCALKLATDEYVLKTLSLAVSSGQPDELHMLGLQYEAIGRADDAEECQEELRKRINDLIALGSYDARSVRKMCEQYVDLAAATGRYRPAAIVASIRGFRSFSGSLFRRLLCELSKKQELPPLVDLHPFPLPLGMRRDFERAVVRLAGACRANLHEWPVFKRLRKHPIVGCWSALYENGTSKVVPYSANFKEFDQEYRTSEGNGKLRRKLHCLFFDALANCLSLQGAPPPTSLAPLKNRAWLDGALKKLIAAACATGALVTRGERPGFDHCFRFFTDLGMPQGFEDRTDLVAVKQALVDIAADLFLILSIRFRVETVPNREWEATLKTQWFDFEYWRARYISEGIQYISSASIADLVATRELQEASRVSQFNERAEFFLGLCELALSQREMKTAKRLLERAVTCVVSYGWRKDMTIFHVLDAIGALSASQPSKCLAWLHEISPAVAAIDVYTDADETNYAKIELADLFFKLEPKTFGAFYSHLLRSAEWYDAERVFACLLENGDLTAPGMNIATTALWGQYEVGALRKRMAEGDASSQAILERNARGFGLPPSDLGKERRNHNSDEPKEADVDPAEFKPSEVPKLVATLRDQGVYVGERKVFSAWFEYWVRQGMGLEILNALEPFLEAESVPTGVSELLDDAFALCLKLKGKREAYKWIVAAQIQRHGWDSLWPSEAAVARFRVFGTHYRNEWKRFVLDTSKSTYRRVEEKLLIPHNRLVQFLVEIDEIDEASAVTQELVKALLNEVADQPLGRPAWLPQS